MHQNYREIPAPLQGLWNVVDDVLATTPSYLRMMVRATLFVIVTLTLAVPYAMVGLASDTKKRPIAKLWYRACAKICGLSIHVKGDQRLDGSTLLTCNHVSYLDIIVLGFVVDARFVAKSEVAGWPLFGILAKLANTVFVTRDARQALRDSQHLGDLLRDGQRLILFPEGTSSNGRAVLPFRASLFSAVDPKNTYGETHVQPVSIAYTDYADGRPLTGALTDLYAWYGDMTLFGHLMNVFGLRGAEVEVTFQSPLSPSDYADRKEIAVAAEGSVRDGLNASWAGH